MMRLVKSEMHMLRSRRLAGCRRNILFFIMMKMTEKLANSPMTMITASTANATKQTNKPIGILAKPRRSDEAGLGQPDTKSAIIQPSFLKPGNSS